MFDLEAIIKTAGYVGVAAIVFAESGLFIGFFLPGDSLLFTAGIIASQGYLDVAVLCAVIWVAAVLGDSVGYAFGKKVGPAIFKKEDSLLFRKSHIERSRAFFERHGPLTIVVARFVPIVRTFAPILAGVGTMRYRTFLAYNLIGGAIWGVGLTLLGYYLGKAVPNIERYILPGIAVIILLSVAPGIYHVLKDKESRDALAAEAKKAIAKIRK